MEKYKTKSIDDNDNFVVTDAYLKLYNVFRCLKTSKGHFIHVIGSPGTGKSSNIYYAINDIDLNVYNVTLFLDSVKKSPNDVFKEIFNGIKKGTGAKTKEDVYKKVKEYDVILFADKFLDSKFLDPQKVGFSDWVDYNGIKSLPFYLLCCLEYLKHKHEFKEINIILHHSWMIKLNGTKYDLLTDFGLISKAIVSTLNLLFEVVKISYSRSETIKIIKSHSNEANENLIKFWIHKYGFKPRYILEAIENNNNDNNKRKRYN